jgi:hypothetical protein
MVVSVHVNRAVLESTSSGEMKATAVEVSSLGKTYMVKAKKEVIFSAG